MRRRTSESTSSAGTHADRRSSRGSPGLRSTLNVVLPGLIVGALVRTFYLLETQDVPFLGRLSGDAAGYYSWACEIAAGSWLGDEAYYQAPLYPYTLAVWFLCVGKSVALIRVLQAALGLAGCLMIASASGRLFGRRVGRLTGVLAAIYPPEFFFEGIVQKTSLAWFLICGLTLLLVRFSDRRTVFRAMGIGAVLGLLVLTRENAWAWLPLIGVWIGILAGVSRRRHDATRKLRAGDGGGSARRPAYEAGQQRLPGLTDGWNRRRAIISVVGFLGGFGGVLLPVAVRNLAVSGDWVISTYQAGTNFYIGNRQGASGRYEPLVPGHETPTFEREDARLLAETASGKELSPQAVSSYWSARAWREIKANPWRWVVLLGKKWCMVWNRYEVSDVESLYIYAYFSRVLNWIGAVWHFGVLVPLAVIGMWCRRRDWRIDWIYYAMMATMAGSVAFFYVMARYRYPLVPLLMPFAAMGLVHLVDEFRGRRLNSLLTPILLAAGVGVFVNCRVYDEQKLDALSEMNLGVALASQGDLHGSMPWFVLAVSTHPRSAEAQANLAQALALTGRYSESIGHYEAALAIEPALPGAAYNLAVAYERVGRRVKALAWYKKAVKSEAVKSEAVKSDDTRDEAARALERLGSGP